MVVYELSGNEIIFRVPITPNDTAFNTGKVAGRGLPLQLLAQSTDPELLQAAKVAQVELEQLQAIIQALENDLAGMKPGAGIAGLLAFKRAQTAKQEEIAAGREVEAGLQRQAGNTFGELAGSIGGRPTQVTMPCPDDVKAVLDQLEDITNASASLLIEHAGVRVGFHAGRAGLDSLTVARNLINQL